MESQRYILENPHNFFIGIKDQEAPKGAQYIKYWNDQKHLPEAKEMVKKLNNKTVL